jgi:deoxyribonuclease V
MQIPSLLRWDVSPEEAVQIQRELAQRVCETDVLETVRRVAGVDVGLEGPGKETARAAIVVLQFPELVPIAYAIARVPVTFPYIPGLLAFREIPAILHALEKIRIEPDVLIVDGHGRAHPRRLGIASHLGVLLERVTIGCAKSILCGHAAEPPQRVGAWTPLLDGDECVGAAVRTRASASPVYVSVGHRITLSRAIELVLQCCKGYRLPETTRYAHRVAGGHPIPLGAVQTSWL